MRPGSIELAPPHTDRRSYSTAFTDRLAEIGFFKVGPSKVGLQDALKPGCIVLLACTAGFCEELIFRGYLQRQFSVRTRSVLAGIIIQALVFGLVHGYQGKLMLVIFIYRCMFGACVHWRKSLHPAMIANGIEDALGGLAYFLSMR